MYQTRNSFWTPNISKQLRRKHSAPTYIELTIYFMKFLFTIKSQFSYNFCREDDFPSSLLQMTLLTSMRRKARRWKQTLIQIRIGQGQHDASIKFYPCLQTLAYEKLPEPRMASIYVTNTVDHLSMNLSILPLNPGQHIISCGKQFPS